MKGAILIVDDEINVLTSLRRALNDEPYEVLTAQDAEQGMEILKQRKIKVVISDEKMPGMQGTEFLASVKNVFPRTVRIMLTGYASLHAAMNAVNSGEIYRFFSKPWDDIQIKLSIRSAIEKYDLEEENMRLLKTVRQQSDELKQLEARYPGITSISKDSDGNFVIADAPGQVADLNQAVTEIISENDDGSEKTG